MYPRCSVRKLALLQIVWMNFRNVIAESSFPKGFAEFRRVAKLGMNWGMGRKRRLVDVYRFPAFRTRATVGGVFGDPKARVV
jgi:hypothetical protein